MNVIEPAPISVIERFTMKRKESAPTFSWSSRLRIVKEICLRSQPAKRGHHRAPIDFEHELGQKCRIFKIGKGVIEALLRVHPPDRGKVRGLVTPDRFH